MNQPRPTNRLPHPNLLPPQNYPPTGNVQMFNPYSNNQISSSNGSWAPPPSQPHEQQVKDPWNWDDSVGSSSSHMEPKPPAHLAHNLNNHPPPMYSSSDFLQRHPVPHFPLEHQPQHQTNNNQYDNSGSKQNWGWNEDYNQQSNQNGAPIEPMSANNPNDYQPGLQIPPPSGNGFPTNLEHKMSNMSLSNREEPKSWEAQPNSQANFHPSRDEVPSWTGAPSWGSLDAPPPIDNIGHQLQFSGLGERSTFADGASFSDGSQVPTYPMTSSSNQYGPNGAFPQQQEELVSPYPHYPPPTNHPSMVPLSGPPSESPLAETSLNSATGPLTGPPTGPLAGPLAGPPTGPLTGPPTGPPTGPLTGPPTGPLLAGPATTPATIPASGSAAAVLTAPPTTLLAEPPIGPPTGSLTGPLSYSPDDPLTGPPAGLPIGLPPGLPTGLPTGPPSGLPTGPPSGFSSGPPTGPPSGFSSGPLSGLPIGPLTGPPAGLPVGPPTGLSRGPPTGPPTGPTTGPPTGPLSGSLSGSLTGPLTGPPTGLEDHTGTAIENGPESSLVVADNMVLPVSQAAVAPPLLYVPASTPPMAGFDRIDPPPLVKQGIPHDPSFGQSSGSRVKVSK